MKNLVLILLSFFVLSVNAQSTKPNGQKSKKSNVQTENCYCCAKPYTRGNGFFYYKEAGKWYFYEQRQDLLGVAIGRYSCSRKCAKDCPVR